MKKGKKVMPIVGIVILAMALWLAFCGWQWSWGPFAKLHDRKLASLQGNAEAYAPENAG